MVARRQSLRSWLAFPWKVRNTPSQLAWGVVLGFAFGVLPKDNLLALSLPIAILYLPANVGTFALATLCGLLLGYPLDLITHPLGKALLHFSLAESVMVSICNLPILPWLGLHNTVVLGSITLLSFLSPIQFLASYRLFRSWIHLRTQQQIDAVCESSNHYKATLLRLKHQPNSITAQIDKTLGSTLLEEEPETLLRIFQADDAEPTKPVDPFVDDTETHPTPNSPWMHDPWIDPTLRVDPAEEDDLKPTEDRSPSKEKVSVLATGSMAPLRSSATAQEQVESQYLRPGLRLDFPERESSDRSATSIDSPEVKIQQEALQLGDVLRETLIEVVRFRPSAPSERSIVNSIPDTPVIPALDSSHGDPRTDNPSALSGHSLPTPGSPLLEPSRSMHVQTRPSASEPATRTEHTAPTSTTAIHPATVETPAQAVQPAEESLRYLLWHLSSLNRESKQ